MITQQLQERAKSCSPWTDVCGATSSSSNLLTVPGSQGAQSSPYDREYSLEYVGCVQLDSAPPGSGAALDKVVKKLRERRKKAHSRLRKTKSVVRQPSVPAQEGEEINTLLDKASLVGGRSGIIKNGECVARQSRNSESSSEGGVVKEGTRCGAYTFTFMYMHTHTHTHTHTRKTRPCVHTRTHTSTHTHAHIHTHVH